MVANMRSGLGDPTLYDFVKDLGTAGSEVTLRFLNEGGDLAHLLRDAAQYDRIVAAGGDGTLSSVAYALRNTGLPIVPYPAGTANLLARNLHVPMDPHGLAALTLAGRTIDIDIGELTIGEGESATRRGFVIMAGAGFDAAVMTAAQELKPIIGEGAYIIGAIQNLQPTLATFDLELDGKHVRTEGIAVILVNLARIQFDLAVTHGSNAQDGLLEVVVVKTRTVAGLIPAIWAALLDRIGHHPARPALEVHTASDIRISSTPELPMQADGDTLSGVTPLRAHVLKRAARFVIPQDAALPADNFGYADGPQ